MFGFNFLHRLLGDVHTPHYFNEIALIGLAADKPTGANAKDSMLYFETDTRLWKRYRVATSSWEIISTDTRGITFNLGLAIVGTKIAQVLIPSDFTILEVIAYADVAPVGADLKVNIKTNGSSLWDDSDRLIISAGAHSGSNSDLDHTALTKGDRSSIDIDQVGSTTPGGDDLIVSGICL